MMGHFGVKATVATLLNAGLGTAVFYRELRALQPERHVPNGLPSPVWLRGLHLLFLGLIVLLAHHPRMFMGVFLFFLGLTAITPEFQSG
jgi:hypothetical protein